MCLSLPAKVLSIDTSGPLPMAEVDFGGVCKNVCIAYAPQVQVGQYVVVHVGFAITILHEERAMNTLLLAKEKNL